MDGRYSIQRIGPGQLEESGALGLAWQVFEEYVAPGYVDEGVQTFRDNLRNDQIHSQMVEEHLLMWGCFEEGRLVGMMAVRSKAHISLLFVEKEKQRQGIGRALYGTALTWFYKTTYFDEITVNASPGAVETYKAFGFVPTGEEKLVDGIRFVPMAHRFR